MNKAVERIINQIYKEVYKKTFTKPVISELLKGSKVKPTALLEIMSESDSYKRFAEKFAKELAKKGLSRKRGVWRKYYEAARKMHYVALPPTFSEFQYKVMSEAVKENFTMIKSIPKEMIKLMEHKYVGSLIEEVAKGNRSRGSFERELASHGAKNAKLIARTETAKLQTAIDRQRATEIGSVAYFWRSSLDKRTRPSHKAMNGVVVFWMPPDKKPLLDGMRGDAGEFPNCRCDDEPIFDEHDLKDLWYQVYDYRVDKLLKLSKLQLLEALQAGGLNELPPKNYEELAKKYNVGQPKTEKLTKEQEYETLKEKYGIRNKKKQENAPTTEQIEKEKQRALKERLKQKYGKADK